MDISLGLIGSKPTQQKEKQGNQMRSLDQIIQNAGKRTHVRTPRTDMTASYLSERCPSKATERSLFNSKLL